LSTEAARKRPRSLLSLLSVPDFGKISEPSPVSFRTSGLPAATLNAGVKSFLRNNLMKNFFEFRGQMHQIVYDPLTGTFGSRRVNHPFESPPDPLTAQMLEDIGIGTGSPPTLSRRFAA
jgi:hypothetical protein